MSIVKCGTCRGTGKLYSDNGPAPQEVLCHDCDGAGTFPACATCGEEPQPSSDYCRFCDPEREPAEDDIYVGDWPKSMDELHAEAWVEHQQAHKR